MGVSDWESIRPKFREVVFRRTVSEVAREIPATRRSVYNWIEGRHRPSLTARARIEEIVSDDSTDG